MDARSDPASGSEKPWHQSTVPAAIAGSNRCFCSSVPAAMMAGAIQLVFTYCGPRGSPAPQSSSPMMICSHGEASRPP
jgi:hypothetical protein